MNTTFIKLALTSLLVSMSVAATSVAGASANPSRVAARDCNPCAAGQALSWHGTAYRVARVRTATRIGDGFTGGHADGVFVVVTLVMTDLKSRPSTILADAVRIRTRAGYSYSQSDKAFAVYDNGFDLLANLQPHLPKTVTAVYDVPRNGSAGAQLEIEDLGTGSKGRINLGL